MDSRQERFSPSRVVSVGYAYVTGTLLLARSTLPSWLVACLALPWLLAFVAPALGLSGRRVTRSFSALSYVLFLAYLGLAFLRHFPLESTAIAADGTRLAWSFLVVICAWELGQALRGRTWIDSLRSMGTRNAFLALGATTLAGSLCCLVAFWWEHPLGPDAGSYLMQSRRVADGRVPYVDFPTLYHAGVFYFQNVWFALLGEGLRSVRLGLLFQHLVVATALALVLRLRLRLSSGAVLSLSGLYLMALPEFEGLFYVIEPMASASGWPAIALGSWMGRVSREPASEGRAVLWLAALAQGILVSAAGATKQPGLVFLVALFIVHVDAGKLMRPVLALQLVGALSLPLGFFVAHPSALAAYLEQNFLDLWSYAQGTFAPTESWSARLLYFVDVSLSRNTIVFAPLGLAAIMLLKLRPERRGGNIALVAAGILSAAPCLVRSYQHYLLFPWPFAAFSTGVLGSLIGEWRARSKSPTAPLAALVGAALLLFGLAVLGDLPLRGRQAREGARREGRIARFVDEHRGGSRIALILPNSPQFYFLTGTRSPDDDYAAVDNQISFDAAAERFRRAAEGAVPAFLIDRGGGWLEQCRRRLIELGYVKVAETDHASYYALESRGGTR